MRIEALAAVALLSASPATASVVIEFDEYANGTLITDQYADFSVDLVDTDVAASILISTYVGGAPASVLQTNSFDNNSGYEMEITFNTLVNDLQVSYSAINSEGGVTVDHEAGTDFVAGDLACRIIECLWDLSGFKNVSSLFFSFNDGTFDPFDQIHIERMSYTIGTTVTPPEIPLPASGFLLLAGLAGLGVARARRG